MVLVQLLETKEMAFPDEASLELALFFYRENNVDFADQSSCGNGTCKSNASIGDIRSARNKNKRGRVFVRDGLTMITFTPDIQYYEDWQGCSYAGYRCADMSHRGNALPWNLPG